MLVAAAAFGSLFASSPTFAEQMDCSGTKKSKERPYTEVIRPGDRPDHEMRQAIRTHVISSKNVDFDGSEQTVYPHEDSYANAASGIDGISTSQSGTSVGYFLYTLKNGEKIWAKFDSVYSTSSGAPAYSTTSTQGSWEVTYQGVFHFVGGHRQVRRHPRRWSLQGHRYPHRRVRGEFRLLSSVLNVPVGVETASSMNEFISRLNA